MDAVSPLPRRRQITPSELITHHPRINALQGCSCSFGFGLATVERVGEFKERLSNRIGIRDGRRVDEGDLPHAPRLDNIPSRVSMGLDRERWARSWLTINVRAT